MKTQKVLAKTCNSRRLKAYHTESVENNDVNDNDAKKGLKRKCETSNEAKPVKKQPTSDSEVWTPDPNLKVADIIENNPEFIGNTPLGLQFSHIELCHASKLTHIVLLANQKVAFFSANQNPLPSVLLLCLTF